MGIKRVAVTIAAMASVAASAHAGSSVPERERVVAVCVNGGNTRIAAHSALRQASKIFAEAGVRLEWRLVNPCPSAALVIRITFSEKTEETRLPTSFAYAYPFETHIVVFSDRVASKRVPRLLAYVLVHEITHILHNTVRHSAAGIMKADWDKGDYFEMGKGRLGFTEIDIALIHAGMDRREAQRDGALR